MSIEQLLAKYKVQLPNKKDQSEDAEESSQSEHSMKEDDMNSTDISLKYLLRRSPNKMVNFKSLLYNPQKMSFLQTYNFFNSSTAQVIVMQIKK